MSARSLPAETNPLVVLHAFILVPLKVPLALILPDTVSFSPGVVVPMPTLPSPLSRMTSAPLTSFPVETPRAM